MIKNMPKISESKMGRNCDYTYNTFKQITFVCIQNQKVSKLKCRYFEANMCAK